MDAREASKPKRGGCVVQGPSLASSNRLNVNAFRSQCKATNSLPPDAQNTAQTPNTDRRPHQLITLLSTTSEATDNLQPDAQPSSTKTARNTQARTSVHSNSNIPQISRLCTRLHEHAPLHRPPPQAHPPRQAPAERHSNHIVHSHSNSPASPHHTTAPANPAPAKSQSLTLTHNLVTLGTQPGTPTTQYSSSHQYSCMLTQIQPPQQEALNPTPDCKLRRGTRSYRRSSRNSEEG